MLEFTFAVEQRNKELQAMILNKLKSSPGVKGIWKSEFPAYSRVFLLHLQFTG